LKNINLATKLVLQDGERVSFETTIASGDVATYSS
jgi:hypothetical protein